MTCFDNPLSGQPLNYDPTEYSNKVVATNNGSGMASHAVPHTLARDQIQLAFSRDLDTTAMRLKDAFGYMTKEEATAELGDGGKMMFAGPGYAYQASPGSFYYMKTQAYSGDLSTKVSKSGKGSRVIITYEQKRSDGPDMQTVMRQVRSTAEKAMQ